VSALVVEVADAMVRTLNEGTFSQSFTAERTYNPERPLAEYTSLRVTVVPKSRDIQFADRSRTQQDVAIDVAIQRRVASDTETDEMMALVDEVLDYWKDHRVLKDSQQNPLASWLKAGNEPIFVPKHLREDHVLTSVLTLTFRVIR